MKEQKGGAQQGLAPSQGREAWTHWSQACLEVVARDAAAAAPFLRALCPGSGRSPAWHLFTWRERRSLRAAAVSRMLYTAQREHLPTGELVAAVLALVRAVPGVCGALRWGGGAASRTYTHGSACGGRHAVGG